MKTFVRYVQSTRSWWKYSNLSTLQQKFQCISTVPMLSQRTVSYFQSSFNHMWIKTYCTHTASTENVENGSADSHKKPNVSYSVSYDDFKWVRRLLPPSVVPTPPSRSSYPSATGYQPPSETVPDEPYFIARNLYHSLPVYVKRKHLRVLTRVVAVEGDIWALEKQLIELVRPSLRYDPATQVHEVTRTISIKGDHQEIIKQFLLKKGF